MRGNAEQRNTAVDPALGRIAVAQHPELPVFSVTDDVWCALMHVAKARVDFSSVTGLPATGSGASL